jgi:hypothetical protein
MSGISASPDAGDEEALMLQRNTAMWFTHIPVDRLIRREDREQNQRDARPCFDKHISAARYGYPTNDQSCLLAADPAGGIRDRRHCIGRKDKPG